MIEFIQDWWTLGLLIAWAIAAYAISLRDNWWLMQMYMQDYIDKHDKS